MAVVNETEHDEEMRMSDEANEVNEEETSEMRTMMYLENVNQELAEDNVHDANYLERGQVLL